MAIMKISTVFIFAAAVLGLAPLFGQTIGAADGTDPAVYSPGQSAGLRISGDVDGRMAGHPGDAVSICRAGRRPGVVG